ncbi:MAG: alkaline phosphatase [Acutalibacteraceae bacterium]
MKKLLSALIAIAMLCSFTACASSQGNGSSDAPSASQIEVQTETQAAEEPEVEKLEWVDYAQYSLEEDVPAKNIILLIGDGMGKNIIKASEVVKGDKLVMSGMPHSTTVTTYSQSVTDGKAEYTDSAASATAISAGVKTTNEALGVDPDGEDVETICEFAQKLGMKTGLVARQIMCHATPAGMVIHNTSRGSYPKIMLDMVRSDVDVMFGGGSQYYSEYTKIQSAVSEHKYKYITTGNELKSLSTADGKVLGLFSYDNMGAADMSPSLMKMTAKSLDLLDNDKGFFLMVEGSNIDSYEHKSDMETVLGQMQGFDETVDYVLKWAQEHPGTLVIVTADHETGGVQLPENPKPEDINNTCFTSDGKHTNADVPLMASGAQSAGLCEKELIDNTDIAKYMRKVLSESHK